MMLRFKVLQNDLLNLQFLRLIDHQRHHYRIVVDVHHLLIREFLGYNSMGCIPFLPCRLASERIARVTKPARDRIMLERKAQ
jgi:hypothetical protein